MRRSGGVRVKDPADPVQLPQGGPHRQVAHHSHSPLLVDVYQSANLTCTDAQEWAGLGQGTSRPCPAPTGRSTQAGSSPQLLATAGRCLSGSCPTCKDAQEWEGPGQGPSRPCPAPSGRSTQAGSSPQPLATAGRCLAESCPSHRLNRQRLRNRIQSRYIGTTRTICCEKLFDILAT
jgi:hypothetical protein